MLLSNRHILLLFRFAIFGFSSEFELPDIKPKNKTSDIKWIVSWTRLQVKENIGKGPIGDFYRAILDGKEV